MLCPLPGLGEVAGLFTLLLQGAAGMGPCSFIGGCLEAVCLGRWGQEMSRISILARGMGSAMEACDWIGAVGHCWEWRHEVWGPHRGPMHAHALTHSLP